jgi:hypothetical protein
MFKPNVLVLFQAIVTPMYLHQKQALHWMSMVEKGNKLPPFWDKMPNGLYVNCVTHLHTKTPPKPLSGGTLFVATSIELLWCKILIALRKTLVSTLSSSHSP